MKTNIKNPHTTRSSKNAKERITLATQLVISKYNDPRKKPAYRTILKKPRQQQKLARLDDNDK
jgi:hypothetical protein